MEIPPELFKIVREYATPRFYQEYNEIIQLLEMEEWPELKGKLQGENAEQVAVALKMFKAACLKAIPAEIAYAKVEESFTNWVEDYMHRNTYDWETFHRLKRELNHAIMKENEAYTELMELIES